MSIHFIKKSVSIFSLIVLANCTFGEAVPSELSVTDLAETPTLEQIFRAIESKKTDLLDRVFASVAWEDFVKLKHPVEGAYKGMTPMDLVSISPHTCLREYLLSHSGVEESKNVVQQSEEEIEGCWSTGTATLAATLTAAMIYLYFHHAKVN